MITIELTEAELRAALTAIANAYDETNAALCAAEFKLDLALLEREEEAQ